MGRGSPPLIGYRQHGDFTLTFAPAVGPAIGGWLTDNWGWPWIFYLNLVPGALMLAAVGWGLAPERPRLDKLRHGDWAGVVAVATGLGCLQDARRRIVTGSHPVVGVRNQVLDLPAPPHQWRRMHVEGGRVGQHADRSVRACAQHYA